MTLKDSNRFGNHAIAEWQGAKEEMIHQGMVAPQFFIRTAGGPAYTNSQGVPGLLLTLTAMYREILLPTSGQTSARKQEAKMVYEYLLQFTDDPYVKETLRFLMTREIAHFQMFEAALCDHTAQFSAGRFTRRSAIRQSFVLICRGQRLLGALEPGRKRNCAKISSLLTIR